MTQTIFHLENRGGIHMYHFIFFYLAGLYYIENKLYNIKDNDANKNGSTFPILNKVVSKPSHDVTYPIKIHMNDVKQFHREAFDILKDKFVLVEDLNSFSDYEVVNIYGGRWLKDLNIIATYIRNLFISRIKNNSDKKNIFLTRKVSNQFHNGIMKRYMRNEVDFLEKFKKYDFEYVVLEELSFKEKIQLFMGAKNVISTHSGGLCFIIFCNKDSNIIEILNQGTRGFSHCHYQDIASVLKLTNFKRYNNIIEDNEGNFDLNINDFEHFYLQNV